MGRTVVLVALLWSCAAALESLNVKVLAQRRESSLRRLLDSLDAAWYPADARVHVAIHVDALPEGGDGGWGLFRRPSKAVSEREAVIALAEAWVQGWKHGRASVHAAKANSGVRAMWLSCYDPSIFGEENARAVILEDDVELSAAWYAYLRAAVRTYSSAPGVAGVSLQRQASRLDAYASELGTKRVARNALAPLTPAGVEENEVFLFAHVGSWGFSPEPRVWHAFREWMLALEKSGNLDSSKKWAVGADGLPLGEGTQARESLVSRWYRAAIAGQRGEKGMLQDALNPKGQAGPSSMWTAHFDRFCAERGMFVLHPNFFEQGRPVALAVSWLEPGEHYSSAAKHADDGLLSLSEWRLSFANCSRSVFPPEPRRISISGDEFGAEAIVAATKRFYGKLLHMDAPLAAGRQLLDVNWELSASLAQSDVGAAQQGLWGGMVPLEQISQAEALCILKDQSLVILGDSIHRYFTFTLNYFLKTGKLAPEFGGDNFDQDIPDSGCGTWGCGDDDANSGTYVNSNMYDTGTVWSQGFRSSSESHRQRFDTAHGNGVTTRFYFIQGAWYDELASIADDVKDFDIVLINSGWWELKGDCGARDDPSPFYEDPGCLDAYQSNLESLNDNILRFFNNKVSLWRQTSCCGVDTLDPTARTQGAIAALAMNTLAERVMAENSVEVLNVNPLSNTVNHGNGDPEDPEGRSFDGSHPRTKLQFVWIQMVLNKIARENGRESICLAAPTQRPTTVKPTPQPTPKPTVKPSIAPTPQPTLKPTARPTPRPTTPEPTAETCTNGFLDVEETDVDCGGSTCDKCAIGRDCLRTRDCSEGECLNSVCVDRPTSTPTTARPTATPTTGAPLSKPTASPSTAVPTTPSPTGEPTTGAPAGKPTHKPTMPPAPWPTKAPTPRPPSGSSGGGYGGSDNVRVVDSACSASDHISYHQFDWGIGSKCPTSGQKLMLTLGVGLALAFLISACVFAVHACSPARRTFAANVSQNKKEGYKRGPHAGAALEDELSNSALQVLRQMEDVEDVRGDEARGGTPPMPSVAEGDETGEATPAYRGRPSGKGSQKKASLKESGRASRGEGSSYVPRTNVSLVNKTLSISRSQTHSIRTSSYAEPHLNSRKQSSVAFSFYDGGDSESDDDGEESKQGVAQSNQPRPSKKTEPPQARGAKAFWNCVVGLELAVILFCAAAGEHRMPSGVLPAGTVTQAENPDLFIFLMACLVIVSLMNVEILADGEDVFLSRAQANEWKGWMQVAFLSYHYSYAQDVYVPIRWCVSAYIWLTGFGNGVFFWSTADYSVKRFAQQLWRMNFLCLFLSLATGTPWIEYYFVALVTVHFILIYLSCGAARVLGVYVFGWEKPNKREHREACYAEKSVGVCFMIGLSCALWAGQTRDSDDYKGAYYYVFKWWMERISKDVEQYFWIRTKMDYLASTPGLVAGAFYSWFRDAWPAELPGYAKGFLFAVAGLMMAAAVYVVMEPEYCCYKDSSYHPYRKVGQWVGTLWIPLYLLVRNAHPALSRRIAKPMEYIGMHSLEFYLLQFHVFMNKQAEAVLYIIPHEDMQYTNMVVVAFFFVILTVRSLEVTNAVRNILWAQPRALCLAASLLVVAMYVTLADGFWNEPCGSVPTALWAAYTVLVVICACGWTIKSL
ncbi:10 TM acyl transferase domain found in Cas1p-domain-containing protein [Pelagophyceae sp. CCMP2097]|nr:10 TM acyl transferase domain found in Cas1p-domain-containing protein [Pelagophyceae sp. CCMP2097]